jgi:hypothetical protein
MNMTTIFEYNCIKCGIHHLALCSATEKKIHGICAEWECAECGSVVSHWQFVDILFIPNDENKQITKEDCIRQEELIGQVNNKLASIGTDRGRPQWKRDLEEMHGFDLEAYLNGFK